MKAGGHQGEHKRAMASQADGAHAVSKLEKMKLRADAECVNADGIALLVLAREKVLGGESNAHAKAGLVSPRTLEALGCAPGASRAMFCRPGSDFVLSARAHAGVDDGVVLLGEAQRLSLHVCEDESYEWVPFAHPGPEAALASLAIEAQLLHPPPVGSTVSVDGAQLGQELAKRLFDEMVREMRARPPPPISRARLAGQPAERLSPQAGLEMREGSRAESQPAPHTASTLPCTRTPARPP
jgi:hypothetical protein